MTTCTHCKTELPEGSRFCPSCGAARASDPTAKTIDSGASSFPTTPVPAPSQRRESGDAGSRPLSSGGSGGRFAPGQILGERYRIVALAGEGGMGEVYRADDLTLEQPVALKFLPEGLDRHPDKLARFRGEVRLARKVSHRNVCRVHDIGEAAGLQFLSMEYVDGEDLATLLKRIGRLPRDKGLEIARQLCAGLASAHEKGILHRDLKPANVMIDGQGMVRITDFGLAALAGAEGGERVFAGTPAYMAPEQLAGEEGTVRSELYALGLVLYEIFTGKTVHGGATIAEITRQQRETDPASPSTIVDDIDPVVERVILHCLEKNPELRPASALEVAAALPGGDPLAAALAAGEVPSPEMVAAAGKRGAIRPVWGWLCLLGTALALVLAVLLASQVTLLRLVPLEKPPPVLAERSREIIQSLGYDEPVTDSASGFSLNYDLLQFMAGSDSSSSRWGKLGLGRPAAVYFWFRESPRHLIAQDADGDVSRRDPPMLISGERRVFLDAKGRLLRFDAVPPQVDIVEPDPDPADWTALFAEAGLDGGLFAPVDSVWNPPVYCNELAAWEGSLPELPDRRIRVEAGAYRGRPVYFRIHGPWSRAERMQPPQLGSGLKAALVMNVVLMLAALIASALIVRRNLRLGLGDRRGAFRIALYVFVVTMIGWLLRADHVPSPADELELFERGAGAGLFVAGIVWLLYMALEPAVRRRWPQRLVAWSRLLAGRFTDPLVGRDLLLGVSFGMATLFLVKLANAVPAWLGLPAPMPGLTGMVGFGGLPQAFAVLFNTQVVALINALFFLFFPLVLFMVLRRIWAAVAVFFLILVAMFTMTFGHLAIGIVTGALLMGSWIFVALRLGVLASAACFFAYFTLTMLPVTFDNSAWYMSSSLVGVIVVLALAVFGFRSAMGASRT